MDIFIEKIVERKKDSKDYLVIFAAVIVGIILMGVFLIFLQPFFPFALFAVIFGIYYVASTRNLEFEYIVTNGEIDIDKIINRKKRKRVFSANCKDFEVVASVKSDKFTKNIKDCENYINAMSEKDIPGLYFIYLKYKGKDTVILFEPDDRILKAIKSAIPRKTFY